MSSEITSIAWERYLPIWRKNRFRGDRVVALGAPHDLAAQVVGDQCEVVVLAFPADLVDPDLKEVLQPVRLELVGADPADDPPDGVPVDPDQAGDRGLVHRSRQPSDQLLEVAGEPRPVPRERHRFHSHAMLGALKPSELGAEDRKSTRLNS